MKNERKKESIVKSKLENLKKIVTSKQFKKSSRDLVKSLKDLHDTMDVFK